MFKSYKQKALALAAVAGTATQSAMAALPTEVSTALADGKADVATIGAGVLVIAIVIAGFVWLKKAAH